MQKLKDLTGEILLLRPGDISPGFKDRAEYRQNKPSAGRLHLPGCSAVADVYGPLKTSREFSEKV